MMIDHLAHQAFCFAPGDRVIEPSSLQADQGKAVDQIAARVGLDGTFIREVDVELVGFDLPRGSCLALELQAVADRLEQIQFESPQGGLQIVSRASSCKLCRYSSKTSGCGSWLCKKRLTNSLR